MSKDQAKIIQHTDKKVDIGALFNRGRDTHISFDFGDTLYILKGAESIHLFTGSNSLYDKIYLAATDAIINQEALDLLSKAKRMLLLYEKNPNAKHPASLDDLKHLSFLKPLIAHLDDFVWDYINNTEIGDTVNVYIFIIL